MRGYQGELRLFMEFLTDPRYDWSARCLTAFGTAPRQICHEWNTLEHLSDFEGKPTRRPLTFDEVEQLFDYLDSRVKAIRGLGRKGALAAYRDATLFKTYYAYGLRRNEGRQLDLNDFDYNPSARHWGRFGSVHVRYGKAVRGGPPRRRLVWTLPEFDWIIDVLRDYIENVRPRYNPGRQTALWLTERGTTVSNEYVTARFEEVKRGAGLPDDLELHCLRHSYGTHLAEFGYDPEFRREQMGHTYLSTTGIYTHVSRDYKQFVPERALHRLYEPRSDGKESSS